MTHPRRHTAAVRRLTAPAWTSVLLLVALVATAAHAGEGDKDPSSFRGSAVTYRNAVRTVSFDRSADLTYNPRWQMALQLAPRFWFTDVINLRASIDVARELTEDDDATLKNETFVGDLSLSLGAGKWATIPEVEVDVSANLGLVFPTSKASRGDTLLFAVTPGFRLSRTFKKVLSGLSVGYGLSMGKFFHQYTTSELESPIIGGCFASAGGCGRFLNTGVRNTSWRLTNGLDLSLAFTEWLSLSVAFAAFTDFLYDTVNDPRVTFEPQESTDNRHAFLYDIGLSATPTDYLTVSFGALTVNPQQQPDSSNYAPFFNRATALYLDVRLDVAAVVTSMAGE